MENNGIVKSLADYLISMKLNAVLPPNSIKLEPRNGFSQDPDIEVMVFNPELDGVTNRSFELEIRLKLLATKELPSLVGRRIKLTPVTGSGSSYEASINKRGFAQFKDIPPAYYSLELRS